MVVKYKVRRATIDGVGMIIIYDDPFFLLVNIVRPYLQTSILAVNFGNSLSDFGAQILFESQQFKTSQLGIFASVQSLSA